MQNIAGWLEYLPAIRLSLDKVVTYLLSYCWKSLATSGGSSAELVASDPSWPSFSSFHQALFYQHHPSIHPWFAELGTTESTTLPWAYSRREKLRLVTAYAWQLASQRPWSKSHKQGTACRLPKGVHLKFPAFFLILQNTTEPLFNTEL